MLILLSSHLLLADWQLWVGPMAGLVSTGLTVYMGRALIRQHRRQQASPATAPTIALGWDPYQEGGYREERQAPRRQGNPVAVQLALSKALDRLLDGWVIDRSTGGLGILGFRQIEPGTILLVRPAKAPLGTPWIELQVKNCVPQGNCWKLGCEFLYSPTWNLMLLFG